MRINTAKTNKRNCYYCGQPIGEGKKYVFSWCIDLDALEEDDCSVLEVETGSYIVPEDKLPIGKHFFHFPNCLPEVYRYRDLF